MGSRRPPLCCKVGRALEGRAHPLEELDNDDERENRNANGRYGGHAAGDGIHDVSNVDSHCGIGSAATGQKGRTSNGGSVKAFCALFHFFKGHGKFSLCLFQVFTKRAQQKCHSHRHQQRPGYLRRRFQIKIKRA